MISIGLENLADSGLLLKNKRLGLLCNQASTDRGLRHSRDVLRELYGDGLTCLFSPQHGFFSEKQDNMIESDHQKDPVSGLPVFSLYGETRKPDAAMFEDLDVLLIDIVDVGTRVYTFLYTMAYCLEAAAEYGKQVVVLDRPNPVGGAAVEGNILNADCASFVGLYPIPMRHGMTFGELALFINKEFKVGADLQVVSMQGWQRSMLFRDSGFPWVSPSPNMPTPETALVYPGQVIWEGTNCSEGRGTTLPFELVGAPFWEHAPLLERLTAIDLPGCWFRPLVFQPTSGKWAEHPCVGFQLHVTDPVAFLPYRTSLALLQAVMQCWPEEFAYKQPPYEYEFKRLPMDLILGDSTLRRKLEEGYSVLDLERTWQPGLDRFLEQRKKYLLYE
ncbi:MAG: DUF1343 domain-containing protein [Proteobacteria bacterium]|nr:DUF1343 domain-containing protein [Pseudomonadota bacterium]MBU1232940.1 DUF1343 domain-containing protein [Pseudomonadota bacterium]MBU1419119.1 DUF1343 domain-containing protein [Pseudomonadota bacterium]MBU1455975.1 DUF1343 domain-containing protein [Pseudomonadota bacterium]